MPSHDKHSAHLSLPSWLPLLPSPSPSLFLLACGPCAYVISTSPFSTPENFCCYTRLLNAMQCTRPPTTVTNTIVDAQSLILFSLAAYLNKLIILLHHPR